MNRERLEQAIRVLEAVHPSEFYIDHWYRKCDKDLSDPTLLARLTTREGNTCGFVACAVGHMALDPWFNSQGLTLGRDSHSFAWPVVAGIEAGYPELATFFGIAENDARNLFSSHRYSEKQFASLEEVTPDHVAERIKRILEQDNAP
jgi:hypothetical protein